MEGDGNGIFSSRARVNEPQRLTREPALSEWKGGGPLPLYKKQVVFWPGTEGGGCGEHVLLSGPTIAEAGPVPA